MIIKGRSRRCVWWWAEHLQDTEENERVRLVESEGLASENIRDLMCEMHGHAQGTSCKNFMWIAVLNPGPKEHLSEHDWDRAREILEEERGYQGQPYFVIEHEKKGYTHRHVIWSRIDTENMRALPDALDAKLCHAAARKIEIELGLEKVVGPFDREQGTPRPKRAPEPWEMYRGMKTEIDPRDVAAEVTELFHQSDNGKAFQAALEQHGYQLLKGDKRGFVILDSAGKDHSLARRLDGINTKELTAFMRDVDREAMPTVQQGKAQYQDRKIAALEADRATVKQEIEWEEALAKAAIEKEKIEGRFVAPEDRRKETRGGQNQGQKDKPLEQQEQKPPAPELGKIQGEIRLARTLSYGPQGFANALEDRGFILASVTPDGIKTEMAGLLNEWEERRRDPQTWMEHEGGFAALSPELQASALRSFDVWQKQQDDHKPAKKPPLETYMDSVQRKWAERLKQEDQAKLETYVDYVQKKWLEGPKSQLERATGGLAVITPFGSIYTLTPRNTGLERDELSQYLKGIDRAALLSVTDAQAVMQEVREHHREEWLARQPLGRSAGEIRLAYSLTQTGQEFANAIEDRGSILACMTGTDAERLNRWERQRLKEEWKAPAPEKTGSAPAKERAPEDKYRAGELVVVNQYGQIFQLTRQNTGHDEEARAERLKDIDRAALLSVTAAQGVMKEFQQHRQEERRHAWQQKREDWLRSAGEEHWPTMPAQTERKAPGIFEQAAAAATRDERTENLHGEAAKVWTAFRQSGNEETFKAGLEEKELFSVKTGDRKAFASALDDKGITFAVVTKEEAEHSHKQAALARAAGNYAPRFKEGEIVIVTEPRPEYRDREGEITASRRVHKLDQSLAEKYVKTLDNRSQLKGIAATLKTSDERAQQRAADREAARLDYATNLKNRTRITAANLETGLHKSARIAGKALGGIGKGVHAFSNAFDSLFSPKLTPEQIYEGEKSASRREAEAEYSIDFSRTTGDLAQQRRQQENDREAERQRDREAGGRER